MFVWKTSIPETKPGSKGGLRARKVSYLKGLDTTVGMEKTKVIWQGGGEMSLIYGVPSSQHSTDLSCLIIAHGAGGPMHSPFISYLHTELAKKGFLTVKFNFPYMEARRRVPDRQEILEASYRRVVEEVRSSQYKPTTLFIGGKSMGGRIASHIVADGVHVDGLFFLAYPLHPPGKPNQLRDRHLYKISKPMLFLSGTKDPFAKRELMEEVVSKLGSKAQIHWIEGGDHSFNTHQGKAGLDMTYDEVITVLVDWLRAHGSH